jgi:hypothetical protein
MNFSDWGWPDSVSFLLLVNWMLPRLGGVYAAPQYETSEKTFYQP